MSNLVCPECGAVNPVGAQFCSQCEYFFGIAAEAESALGGDGGGAAATATTRAGRVVAPKVETDPAAVTLAQGTTGSKNLQIVNPSAVVDGYRIALREPPAWLQLKHDEIHLMPGSETTVAVTLSRVPDTMVEAQTLSAHLRIVSENGEDKFAEVDVEVIIPREGVPVAITTTPRQIQLVDENAGTFTVKLDNTGSNYVQLVTLSGSDPSDTAKFTFTPAEIGVPAGASATAAVRFQLPELDFGESTNWQLTVTASTGDNQSEAIVAVSQQRSASPVEIPVRVRLEPSSLRVHDSPIADLSLVIDNRKGTQDRVLAVSGRDPEGKVRFTFATNEIRVRAGQQAAMRFSVQAAQPDPGKEASRAFTVVVSERDNEFEAPGAFTQITSPAPLASAALRLHPERIESRNSSAGKTKVVVDNSRSNQRLTVRLSGSDPEMRVRFSFTPTWFEVPPGQALWSSASIAAPQPEAGERVERTFRVEATDGTETISADGTFVQNTSDWRPPARVALTLIGGIVAIVGALTPWAIALPDYSVARLPRIAQALDIVEQTQPGARAAALLLAATMMFGITGTTGKMTRASAIALALVPVGWFVYMETQTSTGGPMYGAILIVVGAVIGFLGGLCVRR